MRLYRQNKQFFLCVISVLLSVFLLYLTLFSLPYPQVGDLNPNTSTSNTSPNMNDSIHFSDYFSTSAILPEEKPIASIDIKIINRSFRDSQRFLFNDLNRLLLLLFNNILSVSVFLSSFRKTSKKTSVISIPIGGHAPPYICHALKCC